MGEPIYDAENELIKAAGREMRKSAKWLNYLNGMILPVYSPELVDLIRRILQDLYQKEQEAQFWQQRAEFAEAMQYLSPMSPMPIYFEPVYGVPQKVFASDNAPHPASPLTNPTEEKKEEHKKKRIIKFEE